jgi:YggT family protein
MGSSAVGLVASTMATFLNIYFVLLVIRILLSWFPNVDWFNPPFSVLSQLTDPYLNLFRSIIPPLGGLDLSPILIVLNWWPRASAKWRQPQRCLLLASLVHIQSALSSLR